MASADVPRSSSTISTALGFVAIACWSTSIAFASSLKDRLGPMTAGAAVFMFAGVVGCGVQAIQKGGLRRVLRMPRAYLWGCGAIFVIYEVSLYLALGAVPHDRPEQVFEVGVINYLWPGLTLVFSVPILKRRARLWLVPGMMIAFIGVLLAMSQDRPLSWSGLAESMRSSPALYLLAFVAAVTWGLYSVLTRKWAGSSNDTAVPLFFLATGVACCLLRLVVHEKSTWGWPAVLELSFMALVPNLLAYSMWDFAMRRGRIILVAAFSYLIPVFSTAVTSFYMKQRPTASLWIACAMVVAGAVLCKLSIQDD
jgi:drug/metabolite transporter (DMT)-like permease